MLERFENELLFLRRDANAGIGDRERDDGARVIEHFLARTPAFSNRRDAQHDIPFLGKFERVREQVADDLLQPL